MSADPEYQQLRQEYDSLHSKLRTMWSEYQQECKQSRAPPPHPDSLRLRTQNASVARLTKIRNLHPHIIEGDIRLENPPKLILIPQIIKVINETLSATPALKVETDADDFTGFEEIEFVAEDKKQLEAEGKAPIFEPELTNNNLFSFRMEVLHQTFNVRDEKTVKDITANPLLYLLKWVASFNEYTRSDYELKKLGETMDRMFAFYNKDKEWQKYEDREHEFYEEIYEFGLPEIWL